MIKFLRKLSSFGFIFVMLGCAPFLTTYNSTAEIAAIDGAGEYFYQVERNISYNNNDFVFFVEKKDCGNIDAVLDVQISGSNGLILRRIVDLRELTWARSGSEMTCVPAGYFAAKRNGDQRPLHFFVSKKDESIKFALRFVNNSAMPVRIAINSWN